MWTGQRPRSIRSIPRGACRQDWERQGAKQAIWFKSWSYGLLPTMESYVHLLVLMTFWFLCASSDSYSIFHHPCVQAIIRSSFSDCGDVILCEDISNESRKSCFLMRLMSLTSIINIMLLISLLESSQSHLCSDPRHRSRHGVMMQARSIWGLWKLF